MGLHDLNNRLLRPVLSVALLTALAGLALWSLPVGGALERWSFDLPTVFSHPGGFPELVLIEMDEPSHDELRQNRGQPWDYRLHARLVDFLRTDGAKVIVFDVAFYETSADPVALPDLARALRAHGNVVLSASLVHVGQAGFGGTQIRRPHQELLGPGVVWGVLWNHPGPKGEADGLVRVHPIGRDPYAALPWVAAEAAGAARAKNGLRHDAERWVRHYGPGDTLPRVSYWQATNQPPGFYRGKTIFIGGRPATSFVGEEVDQFRTPWSRGDGAKVSGLEVTATAWLNLMRGDWLNRTPPGAELATLLSLGALFGGLMAGVTIGRAVVIGAAAAAMVFLAALWLFWAKNLWCNWAVMPLVELPVALVACAWIRHRRLQIEKQWLESPLGDALLPASATTGGAQAIPIAGVDAPARIPGAARNAGAPLIPDYELLRCVGRGAYGEVWLARDVLGGFRAVKVVRRVAFDDEGPYEREFHGLQRFAPISRQHPGLVPVLHVGLQREAGFFYYAMEAADDEQTGARIEPEKYAPRTLARDMRKGASLTATELAEVGGALCAALGFLHGQGLIHRDIKPANVIFIAGQPRLGDVGLVTEVATRGGGVTQVGTEGFIPPEGVGTAAGDLFALGRMLEMLWKKPEQKLDEAERSFSEILHSACAHDPAARPASAAVLGGQLREWLQKKANGL